MLQYQVVHRRHRARGGVLDGKHAVADLAVVDRLEYVVKGGVVAKLCLGEELESRLVRIRALDALIGDSHVLCFELVRRAQYLRSQRLAAVHHVVLQ